MLQQVPYEEYLSRAAAAGYRFNASTPRLELVGWRNRAGRVNYFDDWIGYYLVEEGRSPVSKFYEATTVPGLPWLLSPMHPKGTAILAPGQYEYIIGLHKGKPALVQGKEVAVFRDDTKDAKLDMHGRYWGFFGINIHRAGKFSKIVGPWSAGCQVFKKEADFLEFFRVCMDNAQGNKGKFIYTLLEY